MYIVPTNNLLHTRDANTRNSITRLLLVSHMVSPFLLPSHVLLRDYI